MLFSEEKKWAIEAIQAYFYREHGEELGIIGAENYLEFITEELGPLFYNRAIRDVKRSVLEQVSTIEEAVDVLQKPIKTSKK
jgi:uncharacterized protein (DUF2164 family)